ncbi:hypothetical protein BJ944DRAFT_47452 [Cunninghamella echinulata]|nr:hypothetical protein BJ944DRAFT_47452 [Cunninghamella echinulata]
MSEKKILLLGSGFVAAPAVEYIIRRPENKLTIGNNNNNNNMMLGDKRKKKKKEN